MDRHLGLVPIQISTLGGKILRPCDPLPISGLKAREMAMTAICAFAKQVGGKVPDLHISLPEFLFLETGPDLTHVQRIVDESSVSFYVRIVDKGPGVMWGFCKAWVWDTVCDFSLTEGYQETSATDAEVQAFMKAIGLGNDWPSNNRAQVCRMYLIGKAKSLTKERWLWRPISANPPPVVSQQVLRTAARTFIAFLRCLISEIPMAFQVMRV